MNKKKLTSGISKNVTFLGLVSMFTDISSEIIFSILPLFLTNVLGVGGAIIGLIEGIAESTSSILKLFSGWVSDRIGKRKPLVVLGYSISALTKPIFAVSQSWTHILTARFGDRVGKGFRTAPRDAILADSTDKSTRGKVFGFHRMLDTLGAVLGPIIALSLFPIIGYRKLFLIATIPAFLAVFVLVVFVKVKEKGGKIGKETKFNLSQFEKKLKVFLIVAGLFVLSNFSYAFLLLRAQNIGIGVTQTIFFYLLFNSTCYSI